jgi:YidC/Oxa1 family membrane protein insertase
MHVNIPIWNQYVDFLVNVLNSLATVFSSAGIGIIAFTIIVKTLMLPLTVKALRSSKAMQELQPKIKELQKKHGNDRQRISQETMALYQQYRVNPMAGCLPMVIQIPIFLGLYNAIMSLSTSGAGLWDDPFLWLPSLAHPDPLHMLPIVAGLFQFVQTQMMRPANQPKSTDPQQAMMNSVMNIMPLTVVFFGWSFAAGPVLYWATQSVYSVVQQWFITGWGNFINGRRSSPSCRSTGDSATARHATWTRWSSSVAMASRSSRPARWVGSNARWTRRRSRHWSVPGGRLRATARPPAKPRRLTPSRLMWSRLPGRLEMAPPAPGPGTARGKGAVRAPSPPPRLGALPGPKAGTMALWQVPRPAR